MSIKVTYKDGVFEPLEDVKGARPGQRYTVFSDEELDEIRETLGWLKAAEKSFEFWNNPADAVYDTLYARRHRSRPLSFHRSQFLETPSGTRDLARRFQHPHAGSCRRGDHIAAD